MQVTYSQIFPEKSLDLITGWNRRRFAFIKQENQHWHREMRFLPVRETTEGKPTLETISSILVMISLEWWEQAIWYDWMGLELRGIFNHGFTQRCFEGWEEGRKRENAVKVLRMVVGIHFIKVQQIMIKSQSVAPDERRYNANQNASGLTILPWNHQWGPETEVYCAEWSGECFHLPSHNRWPTGPDVYSSAGRCN